MVGTTTMLALFCLNMIALARDYLSKSEMLAVTRAVVTD